MSHYILLKALSTAARAFEVTDFCVCVCVRLAFYTCSCEFVNAHQWAFACTCVHSSDCVHSTDAERCVWMMWRGKYYVLQFLASERNLTSGSLMNHWQHPRKCCPKKCTPPPSIKICLEGQAWQPFNGAWEFQRVRAQTYAVMALKLEVQKQAWAHNGLWLEIDYISLMMKHWFRRGGGRARLVRITKIG